MIFQFLRSLSRTVLLTPTVTAQQVQRVRALALVVSDSHRVGIVLALFTITIRFLSPPSCNHRVLYDTCSLLCESYYGRFAFVVVVVHGSGEGFKNGVIVTRSVTPTKITKLRIRGNVGIVAMPMTIK